MIHVDATMEISESGFEILRPLLREVIAATLLEDGCLVYKITADITNPNQYHMAELWASEAALKAHLQAPPFQKVIGSLLEHSRILSLTARQGDLVPYDLVLPI